MQEKQQPRFRMTKQRADRAASLAKECGFKLCGFIRDDPRFLYLAYTSDSVDWAKYNAHKAELDELRFGRVSVEGMTGVWWHRCPKRYMPDCLLAKEPPTPEVAQKIAEVLMQNIDEVSKYLK